MPRKQKRSDNLEMSDDAFNTVNSVVMPIHSITKVFAFLWHYTVLTQFWRHFLIVDHHDVLRVLSSMHNNLISWTYLRELA